MPSCWKKPGRAASTSILRATLYPPLGSNRLSGFAGQLDPELLRLECGRFRLGRRYDSKHPLAPQQWGTGRKFNPKIIVLLAGTNNVGNTVPLGGAEAKAADIARASRPYCESWRRRPPAHHRPDGIFVSAYNLDQCRYDAEPDHSIYQRQSLPVRRRQKDPVSQRQRQAADR